MVQTLKSIVVAAGEKICLFEKPHILRRIYIGIRVMAGQNSWYETRISFDDPQFISYYILNGPYKLFEAEGVDIFQGDVWIYNNSSENLLYTSTEILH